MLKIGKRFCYNKTKEKKIKSVFQPIVSLKTGEIVSFEALSRITLESCTLNIEELFKIANTIEQ